MIYVPDMYDSIMLKLRDRVKLHSKTASYVLSLQFEPKHFKEKFTFMTAHIYNNNYV